MLVQQTPKNEKTVGAIPLRLAESTVINDLG